MFISPECRGCSLTKLIMLLQPPHLSVSVPEGLGYPLLEGTEVLLATQTDRSDGLLHHRAVSKGQQAAGHAFLE